MTISAFLGRPVCQHLRPNKHTWHGNLMVLAFLRTWFEKGPHTVPFTFSYIYTLQGTNISHLGKRTIIFKSALGWDMLAPRRVYKYIYIYIHIFRGIGKHTVSRVAKSKVVQKLGLIHYKTYPIRIYHLPGLLLDHFVSIHQTLSQNSTYLLVEQPKSDLGNEFQVYKFKSHLGGLFWVSPRRHCLSSVLVKSKSHRIHVWHIYLHLP